MDFDDLGILCSLVLTNSKGAILVAANTLAIAPQKRGFNVGYVEAIGETSLIYS